MNQSSVVFGTLTIAFIVYITVRGQIPAYLKVLGLE